MSSVEVWATAWLFVVVMACVFNIGMVVGIWVSNFIRKESK